MKVINNVVQKRNICYFGNKDVRFFNNNNTTFHDSCLISQINKIY